MLDDWFCIIMFVCLFLDVVYEYYFWIFVLKVLWIILILYFKLYEIY